MKKKPRRPYRLGWNGRQWLDDKGKKHRLNGPALEFNDGYKSWYCHGTRHREDGPAVEMPSGRRTWYEEGRLTKEIGEWLAGELL